ncbi:hypothetical protein ACXWTF_03305 [Thiomicrolovo sp. ZZH C-3]
MKSTLLAAAFVILLSPFTTLMAAVAVSPAAVKVPYNRTVSQSVRYLFSEPATCSQAVSGAIEVLHPLDLTLLTTIPGSLSVALTNGSATAAESVRVTPAIVNLARQNGARQLIFRRAFTVTCTSTTVTDNADLRVDITTQAASDFALNRIELFFDDHTPRASVAMNDRLNAYAKITFSGSGLLRGYWQVDGRPYPPVSRALSGRESVIVKFSEVQSLPTFNPGSHRVEFVVTSPVPAFAAPYMFYLVGHAPKAPLIPLLLKSPEENAALFLQAPAYRWATSDKVASYLVEFFAFGAREALFSAYTTVGEYTLPPYAVKTRFETGKRYFWRVTGYDSEGNAVAKSASRTFTLLRN